VIKSNIGIDNTHGYAAIYGKLTGNATSWNDVDVQWETAVHQFYVLISLSYCIIVINAIKV
jgi:hypothetical protein